MKTQRITLCGSTRFKTHFELVNKQLSLEGHVVYSVAYFNHNDKTPPSEAVKEFLDQVHLQKIDNSDAIMVLDVDGYIGQSTRSEINYAQLQQKTVKYLSDFPDLVTMCDSYTFNFDKLKLEESQKYNRMDDLLIEVDKRMAMIAKQISNDHKIDASSGNFQIKPPYCDYIETLYSISNYIDENRVKPSEMAVKLENGKCMDCGCEGFRLTNRRCDGCHQQYMLK